MYGYSFMLHTVEEQRAASRSKAEARDELNTYLDTPTFEAIIVKAPSCLKVQLARLVLRRVLIEGSLWEIPKTLRGK